MCQIQIYNFLHLSFYLYLVISSFSRITFASEFDFSNEDEKQKRDCIHTGSTSFDVRAIMIPCSVKYCPCSNIPGQSCKTPDYTLGNTPEDNYRISNCTKKLVITIKMTDMGVSQCKNEYIVVDHVYDPSSEHKQRLLYPYVLKIKKKPIMQTYKLTRESSVNEKSTELVVNKNDKGYKGCKTTGEDTTCKKVMYKNNPVPYSTGFCCSCENRPKNIPRKHKKDHDYSKFDEDIFETDRVFYTDVPKEKVKRKIDLPLSDIEDFPILDEFNGSCTESKECYDKTELTPNPILDSVLQHTFDDTSLDDSINLEDFNEGL
ncbi:hypothetical protein WA026_017986 [Henosepilachna vigintioctopunctata]|uniref:Generative cell specific-1/HAP2 domain-containing protein n=1 Tax=Henosepilachna vigintioctopunctata TaxID=420089 RepID=A0AAW1TZI2_9CUCU